MNEELKVVILLKGNRGSIGVQSPECDPMFSTFEGSLGQALERVPELVAEAQQKWDESPRYAKTRHELEPSTSTPASARTPAPVRTGQRQQTIPGL
jgi:hypothetical protein